MGQLSTANGFSPKLTDLPVKTTTQTNQQPTTSHKLSKPDEPVHEVVLYDGKLVDRVQKDYQYKGETKKYTEITYIRKEKINIPRPNVPNVQTSEEKPNKKSDETVDEPFECQCHKCNQTVMTRIEYTPSGSAWCCCMLLLFSGYLTHSQIIIIMIFKTIYF